MPTSGGLYYAAAVLAPPGYGPLAAWITGWSNWLAQVTAAPSVDYALSAMVLAAASIGSPDYVPQNYQVWLLTAFIMCIHGCISSMPTRWIAIFNSYGSSTSSHSSLSSSSSQPTQIVLRRAYLGSVPPPKSGPISMRAPIFLLELLSSCPLSLSYGPCLVFDSSLRAPKNRWRAKLPSRLRRPLPHQ